MLKSVLNLNDFGTVELGFNELLTIDGGSFWSVLGAICAVAVIVTCAIYAPAVLAVLL